jgi:energy-coupling factor transporter transmembrane protein EcfT
MAKHLAVIAWCSLLVGLFLIFLAAFPFAAKGMNGSRGFDELGMFILGIPGLLFISIFIGLRRRKRWVQVPIGIIGALLIMSPFTWYVIWVMSRAETKALLGLGNGALIEPPIELGLR